MLMLHVHALKFFTALKSMSCTCTCTSTNVKILVLYLGTFTCTSPHAWTMAEYNIEFFFF